MSAPADPNVRRGPAMHHRVEASFVAQLISLVATFANRIAVLAVLLRVWGPEQLSEWIVAASVSIFMSLPDSWMQVQFGNLYHSNYVAQRLDRLNRWVGISLVCYITAYTSLLAASLTLLAFSNLSTLIVAPGRDAGHLAGLLALLIVDRAIVSLRGSIVQLYRANGDLARLVNSGTLLSAVSTIGIVVVTLLGLPALVAAATLIATDVVLGLAVLVLDLRRRMPFLTFQPALPTLGELRRLRRNIGWYAIDHSGLVAVNDLPVIFLAGLNVNPALIVFFTMARALANFVRQLQVAAANSIAFELVNRALQSRTDVPADLLARHSGSLAFMSALFGGVLASQAEPVLMIWSSETLPIDASVIVFLFLSVLCAGPMAVASLTLSYANQPRVNAVARLIQLAVLSIGFLASVGTRPFLGTVASILLAEFAAQIVAMPLLLRRTAIELPKRTYLMIYLRSAAAFFVMYGSDSLLRLLLPYEGVFGLLVNGAIVGVVAGTAAVIGIDHQDRRQILISLRRIAKRFIGRMASNTIANRH